MLDDRVKLLTKLERFVDMAADSTLPPFLPLHYLLCVLVPAAARLWGTREASRILADVVMGGLGDRLGFCALCHQKDPVPGDAERLCAECRVFADEADFEAGHLPQEEPPFNPATAQRIARDLAAAGVEMTPDEVTATGRAAFSKLRDGLRREGIDVPDSLPETARYVQSVLAPVRRAARAALRAADGVRIVATAPAEALFVCCACGKPRPGVERASLFFPSDGTGLAHPICLPCHKEPPCEPS